MNMRTRTTGRTHGASTLVALALAGLAVSSPARAADPPYLDQMPSVERVRADVQGTDRHDTLARQKAAFEQLARGIDIVAGPRRFSQGLTADEQRWLAAYQGAANDARREAYAGLSNDPPGGFNPFARSPLQQWNARTAAYERDASGRQALFARYFSSDVRAALDAAFVDLDRDDADAPGRLAELSPANQLAVRVLSYALLAAMLLAPLREWLPFGTARADPLKFRAGFQRFRLGWTTGHVTGYETWTSTEVVQDPVTLKNMDGTEVRGSSGGRVTRTHVHEQFTLATAGGEPHHVHVVNADIKIPNGHLATAVWAQIRGGQRGAHVLFFDRSDSRTRPVRPTLGPLFRVGRVMYVPVVLPAFMIGDLAGLAGPGTSGLLGGLLAGFVAFVIAYIAFHYVGVRRLRRFIAKDGPRILAAIERAEPAAASTATGAVP
jgi:hypothetical protein